MSIKYTTIDRKRNEDLVIDLLNEKSGIQ